MKTPVSTGELPQTRSESYAPLTPEQWDALRRLDTCTVSNAIETFHVRLRNEGFAGPGIRCLFPELGPMLGHAVTAQIRSSGPPVEGHAYLDRTDWWNAVLSVPPPRVVVIQDIDRTPGRGGFIGEVHANILMALECVGAVTNGAVRDLPAVSAMGFPLFARNPAVSHSYVHIVSVGCAVEIAGLKVQPGDLIHADCHGVLSIPREIAPEIPAAAERIRDHERKLIGLCRAPNFSIEKLRAVVRENAQTPNARLE
jgi:4-hydroxy-4-methyl-2-oxoglutarate aldolase